MKVVLQRASSAAVKINNQTISEIGKGLVIFLGVAKDDTQKDIELVVDKIKNMRIFEDEDGKMNLSINDTNSEILMVPQFTLLGDLQKGRRPSFDDAAKPQKALEFYNKVVELFKKDNFDVKEGKFKEHMHVELVNDGPVTLIFDTKG